jgi:hypothetical protein
MPETPQLPPILQAFGRDLAAAMASSSREPERRRRLLVAPAHPLRAVLLAFAALLALTTITLAASGVILTGTPVRPEELLNPSVGEGIPAPGASQLLALRVPDPEGGLPWGMRIVHTTRGEVCVQVGRVEKGQLGELGIDGAFHDDGRFHPIPPDALPADSFHGHLFDASWGIANANTSCQLVGEAFASRHVGLDRGAAPNPTASRRPLRDLRDISYGLLGPEAVSMSYRNGVSHSSETVVPGIGAYLIVQRSTAGEQIEAGGGSLGTEGDLAPSAPLTRITYRLAGKLCQRGPSLPPGAVAHLTDPCPWPHFPKSPAQTLNLHRPLHAQLLIAGNVITAVRLSFIAPYAASSARDEYLIDIPNDSCHAGTLRRGHPGERVTGGAQTAIGRDVAQGQTVSQLLDARGVFVRMCARAGAKGRLSLRQLDLRSATIQVDYRRIGAPPVLVGSITIQAPAGTRPEPPAAGPLRGG